MLIAATIIAVSFHLMFYSILEMVIMLIIVDFMALWVYIESEKGRNEKSSLMKSIEHMEKSIYDVFNKVTLYSNEKRDKKDLIEWLEKL